MNPYNTAILFFSFCTFFISLLIWLKRQDGVGRSYFIFSVIISLWGLSAAVLLSDNASDQTALFCSRLANVLALFGAVTWFHFCLIFTQRPKSHSILLKIFYVIAVLITCVGFTSWFVISPKGAMNFVHFGRPGPVYHFYLLIYLTAVILGFIQLIERLKISYGYERLNLLGFIVATTAGFIGGSLTYFPAYEIMVPQYGLFLMPIYPFVMAYFLMRGNLFELTNAAEAAHRDKLASIGVLATSINHEVKNPLFIITGLAEGYLSKVKEGLLVDPKERLTRAEEIFEKTIEQSYRASEIIRRFAMFAKEGVKDEMRPEPLAINQVLDDVLPLVRHELELGKIELVRDVLADLPLISADRHHMVQIFFNLLVNACQAMKDGGKLNIRAQANIGDTYRIAAKTGRFMPDSVRVPMVVISITDTGPGMSEEQLREIFQPFRTTKAEGTGLGLYITKLLVEKNGGRISVESKLGEGTRFVIAFSG